MTWTFYVGATDPDPKKRSNNTFVVAFGGELVTDRARFTHFIQDINLLAALGIRLVLVHGARPQIEAALKGAGHRSRFAKGQRITDEAALVAVKHAAGALRVELEALHR